MAVYLKLISRFKEIEVSLDLGVQCLYRAPDLIVEVAHPSITVDYGEVFLDVADYMVCCRKVKSDRKVSGFSGQKLGTRIIICILQS